MKKILLYLSVIALIMALFLTDCKKKPELKVYHLELSDEAVVTTTNKATIIAKYSFPTEIHDIKVIVSDNVNMQNINSYNASLVDNTLSTTIDNLTANTKYYYCFRYSNGINVVDTDNRNFTTQSISVPEVTTKSVTSITSTSAQCGGKVTSDGGGTITARGVCWSTEHNPTISDVHTTDSIGLGEYTSYLTGLENEVTYYVRAYASNSSGTSYGDEKVFATSDAMPIVTTADISGITSTTAICGGNVTSDGGLTVTSRGVCWSTSPNPVLNIFYTTNDGSGTGEFTSNITDLYPNTTYYVRAYATNSVGTSYGEEKVFATEGGSPTPPTWENGVLPGLFSISSSEQVHFSQGNLQYQASTTTWRFADNQYSYVGDDNSNIASTYGGWIDLFGWGTSGYNHGAVAYQPYSTSETDSDYKAYGDITNNLNDQTGKADWGYNAISNGGNQENLWRTLSKDEWDYVLKERNTNSGIRFAKARVNGINGLIILPDDWNDNTYILNSTNMYSASYTNNEIGETDWITLETGGAVFLPTAGFRIGTSMYNTGSYGNYWSTSGSNLYAYNLNFTGSDLSTNFYARRYGQSVRLVYSSHTPAATIPSVTTKSITEITQTTAIGGGTVVADGGADITQQGIVWAVYENPTITDHTGIATGSLNSNDFTCDMINLQSNTTYYVRAYATNIAGTAYGSQISFTTDNASQLWENGVLPGLFSVSESQKVHFAQGNLQYKASTNTWRFADNQYDYIGNGNSNISSTYNGWIDMFGWGTSGYDHGAVAYQPYSTSELDSDYYAYGNYMNNLDDQTGRADWGYNAINNGGNQENIWRTLTADELLYVFNTRSTSSGIRYAKAQVCGANGIILLPDNWNNSTYNLNSTNQADASFATNVITTTNWRIMENAGAVFLPASGIRFGQNWHLANGWYWSTTQHSSNKAYMMIMTDASFNPYYNDNRRVGMSVRLVQDAE